MRLANLNFSSEVRSIQNYRIIIKIIFKLRNSQKLLQMFDTPNKHSENRVPQTQDKTYRKIVNEQINFKQRTFQLMNSLIEMQVKNKKNQLCIRQLLQKIESFAFEKSSFLEKVSMKTYNEVIIELKNLKIAQISRQNTLSREMLNNINKNFEFYKELAVQKKISEGNKNEKQEKLLKTVLNLERQNKTLKEKIEELEMQNDTSRLQFDLKKATTQKNELKDQIQIIKVQYKKRIKELQNMDHMVSEKLQSYQIQIQERQNQYKEEIQKLKAELSDKLKNSSEVSSPKFGSIKSSQEEENYQCYKASIDGLISQNYRLKQCLLAVYNRKEGEELQESIQQEIKIISNIIELQQKKS